MEEKEEENEDKPWIWEEWRQGQEGKHFVVDDEKDVVKDCDESNKDECSMTETPGLVECARAESSLAKLGETEGAQAEPPGLADPGSVENECTQIEPSSLVECVWAEPYLTALRETEVGPAEPPGLIVPGSVENECARTELPSLVECALAEPYLAETEGGPADLLGLADDPGSVENECVRAGPTLAELGETAQAEPPDLADDHESVENECVWAEPPLAECGETGGTEYAQAESTGLGDVHREVQAEPPGLAAEDPECVQAESCLTKCGEARVIECAQAESSMAECREQSCVGSHKEVMKEKVLEIVKRKKRKYVKKSEIGKDSQDIRKLFKKLENKTNLEKEELEEKKGGKKKKEKLENLNLPNFENFREKEHTKIPQKSAKTDVDVIFNVQQTHQQHPAKCAKSSQPIASYTPPAPHTRGGPKIVITKTDKRKREFEVEDRREEGLGKMKWSRIEIEKDLETELEGILKKKEEKRRILEPHRKMENGDVVTTLLRERKWLPGKELDHMVEFKHQNKKRNSREMK